MIARRTRSRTVKQKRKRKHFYSKKQQKWKGHKQHKSVSGRRKQTEAARTALNKKRNASTNQNTCENHQQSKAEDLEKLRTHTYQCNGCKKCTCLLCTKQCKPFENPLICCNKCEGKVCVNHSLTFSLLMDIEEFNTRAEAYRIDSDFQCCFCCSEFQEIYCIVTDLHITVSDYNRIYSKYCHHFIM